MKKYTVVSCGEMNSHLESNKTSGIYRKEGRKEGRATPHGVRERASGRVLLSLLSDVCTTLNVYS